MTKLEIFNDLHRPKKTTDQKVVKGKRTKRPRPSSSTSSSGGGGGDESLTNNSLTNSPSPTSSSTCTITDQEDEDMANCLILLSHGGGGVSGGGGTGGGGGNQQSKQDYSKATQRITNKKFAELTMFTATDAKVGIYVYECKTCNRSFPSFQALGGHRASHRKPKQDTIINTIDDRLLKSLEPKKSSAISTNYAIPSARDQGFMVVKKSRVDRDDKAKVHECSICGSEFASGQALGGHMRRHRSALNNKLGNHDTTSLDMTSGIHDSSPHDVCDEKPRNNNILSFDLNLPALSDDQADGFFLVETTDFLHGGVNGGLQLSA